MARTLRGDHPRSRGVYTAHFLDGITAAGSSPLARGLPRLRGAPPSGRRIIPARAGFTLGPLITGASARDHPRSRGVYVAEARSFKADWGSSPLARGLPTVREYAEPERRIIPARAGFTISFCRRTICHPDHPRSRGVYVGPGHVYDVNSGSSPLARGLPIPNGVIDWGKRIIPARAGFTT